MKSVADVMAEKNLPPLHLYVPYRMLGIAVPAWYAKNAKHNTVRVTNAVVVALSSVAAVVEMIRIHQERQA